MNEVELRRDAVRRRQAGETTDAIADSLGRTGRWVRKWVARHDAAEAGEDWAQSRSRAPKHSPGHTPDQLRQQLSGALAGLYLPEDGFGDDRAARVDGLAFLGG